VRKLVVALLAFSILNATPVFAGAKTVQPKSHVKTHAKAKSFKSAKSKKGGYAKSKHKTGAAKQLKRSK
jgi:hypothetical protein